MADQKQVDSKTEETLMEFPCDFLIKVMGETNDHFTNTMVQVIQVHEPNFDTSKVDMRASSGGRFISLTCSVYVTSKPQLDNIYRALSEHPLVKYVL
ncbi:MAG: YbeD family protein [Candidatus Methylopumilus sp.]|jgi:putative lipoic acid-binding regulatory protein